MKNFNIGHRANFKDKLIANLHLSFPVRSISRGTVIAVALTRNQSPLDVKTLSSLLKMVFFFQKSNFLITRNACFSLTSACLLPKTAPGKTN